MTLTGLGRLTLVLGLAGTLATSVAAQRTRSSDRSDRDQSDRNSETETVTKTVPLSASGRLRITTFSGYVHITGTTGRDVHIKAVRTAARDVLDHVHLTIDSSSASSVTINANDKDDHWWSARDQIVRTDFDIEMPAGATLSINGFSSPLEVTDVTGEEHLKTFSGRITVRGARGPVTAETFDGNVDVDLASAGSEPSLDAHTFSGSIRARIADSTRADVSFNSFSGEFNSDLPLTMRSARRGRVSGRVGSGSTSAELRFQTFSGDVRVER